MDHSSFEGGGQTAVLEAERDRTHPEPARTLPDAAGPDEPVGATPLGWRARAVLDRLDLSPETVDEARLAALRRDVGLDRELVARGDVDAARIATAIAGVLGLESDPAPVAAAPCEPIATSRPPDRILRARDRSGAPAICMAPPLEDLDRVHRVTRRYVGASERVAVVTREAIATAHADATRSCRLQAARRALADEAPRLSAERVLTRMQTRLALLILVLGIAWWFFAPGAFWGTVHIAGLLGFSACIALRGRAATVEPEPPCPLEPDDDATLPVYTVLIALHKETMRVPGLVKDLARLDWPASKLDIKLVCEENDPATVEACRAATAGRPHFSVLETPPGAPQTKPKALNFALPLARGDYIVLYDAEDRPDPLQLREAWQRFRDGSTRLGCLQAPLMIDNSANGWLAASFALEYGGLFRRLLPWLARHRLPIPLGGTSNHFSREALDRVGAWDPYNVTEDADLGLRLMRAGYMVEALTRDTREHAPETFSVWYKQRTRWTKGWMQTWLVHMRDPLALWRDLGARNFAVFQILFFGMLASAFAQPAFFVLAANTLHTAISHEIPQGLAAVQALVDIGLALLGYASFVALTRGTLPAGTRKGTTLAYVGIPFYFALVACMALRGAAQLVFNPHSWEKTPHDMRSRRNAADPRYRVEPAFASLARPPRAVLPEPPAVAPVDVGDGLLAVMPSRNTPPLEWRP